MNPADVTSYAVPVAPGKDVIVEGGFPLSEEEWAQLMAVLGVMKPALVSTANLRGAGQVSDDQHWIDDASLSFDEVCQRFAALPPVENGSGWVEVMGKHYCPECEEDDKDLFRPEISR